MDNAKQKISYPPRLDLANTPTPLKPLKRLGEKLGIELYIKHDDLTGAGRGYPGMRQKGQCDWNRILSQYNPFRNPS